MHILPINNCNTVKFQAKKHNSLNNRFNNNVLLNNSDISFGNVLSDVAKQQIRAARIKETKHQLLNILELDDEDAIDPLEPFFDRKHFLKILSKKQISKSALEMWLTFSKEKNAAIADLVDYAPFIKYLSDSSNLIINNDIIYSVSELTPEDFKKLKELFSKSDSCNVEDILAIYSSSCKSKGLNELSEIIESKLFLYTIGNTISLGLAGLFDCAQYPDKKRLVSLAHFYKNFNCEQISNYNINFIISQIIQLQANLGLISDSATDNLSRMIDSDYDLRTLCAYSEIMKYIDMDYFKSAPYPELLELNTAMTALEPLMEDSSLFSQEEIDLINKLSKKVSESLVHTISPTPASKSDIIKMVQGFFANNNPELENTIRNADFDKYGKQGLPLKYPREEFVKDVFNVIHEYPDDVQLELLAKLGIFQLSEEFSADLGYEGIVDITKLSPCGAEGELLKIATRFIKENEIQTGDEKLDEALNSLIQGMGEFINIIGKKQHSTHKYSLDIHTLKVLQEAMKHPEYSELSAQEKTILKFVCILHDIAKFENKRDPEHPQYSAYFANDILGKYPFIAKMKERIIELIENHHWFAELSNGEADAAVVSTYFRRKNDFKLAKIITEADLKGVSEEFYEHHREDFHNETMSQEILSNIVGIRKTGQLLEVSDIVNRDLIPRQNLNGASYRVIKLNTIDDDFDLGYLGFEKGTHKKDLRFLVHVSTAKNLEDILFVRGACLCTSYISPSDKSTYYNQPFGICFETEPVNIANVSKTNMASGEKKGFTEFSAILTGNVYSKDYRRKYAKSLAKSLKLSPIEYAGLYSLISQYDRLGEFYKEIDGKEIQIGDKKKITSAQLKRSISKASDSMLGLSEKHNEVNLFDARPSAFIAKVDDLSEIPDDYRRLIVKYDLPVILLGK